MEIVFIVIVLIFSVVIHEVSHGVVAERLGDPTARLAGRLTLNPLKHLDPFGSVILPLLLSLLPGGVIFGWAKPVPYDPRNMRHPARDAALVAAAGPVSNIALALVFGLLFQFFSSGGGTGAIGELFPTLLAQVVIVNVWLAIFNLIPIPPLDGSKVLFWLLPPAALEVRAFLERYGWFILLFFIFFGIQFIVPLVLRVVSFFLGV
ncbi:MAG: site-2 protease family protein [Candidatus Jorgensenbacteria bacterium]|nr:site-2 protease family protein [Candidatus Jorgensenbacteria bacterium]